MRSRNESNRTKRKEIDKINTAYRPPQKIMRAEEEKENQVTGKSCLETESQYLKRRLAKKEITLKFIRWKEKESANCTRSARKKYNQM